MLSEPAINLGINYTPEVSGTIAFKTKRWSRWCLPLASQARSKVKVGQETLEEPMVNVAPSTKLKEVCVGLWVL